LDRYYTREEVLAFPDDGNRYELVHGELLVSPSPRRLHQRVVLRLARALADWVERHGLGEVMVSPADISWGGLRDVTVQPDVFVIPPDASGAGEWTDIRQLSLVVEVLSPSTARYDRFTKRRLYQEMKVPLYWLIDIEHRRAEVWTPEATLPVMEAHAITWRPIGAESPFTMQNGQLLGD
ncbi:MAG: Uma2 family endonuclease, partial [Gemmatimonadota bacterium]